MNVDYKDYNHLIGLWEWEKTKFLKQSISKIEAKYKNPDTENKHCFIEITRDYRLITYKNEKRHKTYKIVNYKCAIDSTNTLVIHNYLTLRRYWKNININFQQSTDINKFSAMYFFPFNKQSGASYNWFEKRS